VDIWAAGILMYILMVRKHPFYKKGDTMEDYKKKIKECKFAFPEEISE